MSTIPTVDTAMTEVVDLEHEADDNDDGPMVAACKLVLEGLLERRLHLPQQRRP